MTVVVGLVLGLGVVLMVSALFRAPRTTREPLGRSITGAARDRMAQAGMGRVGIPTVLVVSVVVATAVGAVVLAFMPVAAIGVAASVAALALPAAIVGRRARVARRATRRVWPDVVDHLVSAVRAGLALPDSVAVLAHTGPVAVRAPFAEFEREYRTTGDFAGSLDRLKDHLADPVADRIIETLRMSREVGGSELTTVLRDLAAYLRQDAAIRSELEARQSWVVNAARLGIAAPWVVLLLLSTREEAARAYNTSHGAALIAAGIVLSIVAYRSMIVIGRLPEEHRWFA